MSVPGRAPVIAFVTVLLLVTTSCASQPASEDRTAPVTGPTATGPTATVAATGRPTSTASGTTPPTAPGTGGTAAPGPVTPSRRPASTSVRPSPPSAGGVPANLVGKDLEVMPTSSRVIALTFDGGSAAQGLASITATLERTGTPATFFLTGGFVTRYPAQARSLAATYRIGNHTQDHLDLTGLDDAAVRSQIRTAESNIRSVTGADPRPWFRFPSGARNARTIADANGVGYACIRWTVDTLGWKGTSGGQTAGAVRDRVLNAARPGAIVLMHVGANPDDGSTLDADALPAVISGLKARGYTFVTLDALR